MQPDNPQEWSRAYQTGQDGWDLHGPTPVLQRLLESGTFDPGRVAVLCAGRGHDAREFARHGFEVYAVEFAPEAVGEMQSLADPNAPVEILMTDMFTLPHTVDGLFDYVYEYTCFCAIDPRRRPEYVGLVTRLLKPCGTYIDLAFPLDERPGGPPYSVSARDVISDFAKHGFRLVERRVPAESVPARQGAEELLILVKEAAA